MVGTELNNNSENIVSFTFDEILKDINFDKIFLFVLSYEYDLNFNQIMTLFNFSSDIFWTFINTLKPMLRLGDRKASMLKQTARKIYFKWLGSKVELNIKEQEYYNYFMSYVNDSFTDGNICLHFSTLTKFPLVAQGAFVDYRTGRHLKTVTINNKEELSKYIDSINDIVYEGERYFKTSRIHFLIEKYYGDLNSREVKRKTIKEIINMMNKDAIEVYNQELIDKLESLVQHRMKLVNRNG